MANRPRRLTESIRGEVVRDQGDEGQASQRRTLLGRSEEEHRVRGVLGRARNGRGGALLIEGDPGIGKTALLDATTSRQRGMQVLRIDGYEAESTIPFAAVHRVMIPLRDHLSSLPDRHEHALRVTAGADGPPPDRFLVGLGTLGLLARAGEVEPVACVIDDVHLLDSESLDVFAFVARRLEAESVALIFAGRNAPDLEAQLAGVPTLGLAGLGLEPAVQLLMSSSPDVIDPAAAAQIATATGGNPLALTDLATELTARQLAETGFADEPIPVGRRLEALYVRRVRHRPSDVQLWLLTAAADSTGNIELIDLATQELGLPETTIDEAETVGLVDVSAGTVRFRHPLVRSAAYNAAPGAQRRRVHGALSTAAARVGLVELAAWHAAKTILGTDPAVADDLERVADLAGQRGGFASRANVLAKASALTPPGKLRHTRLVAAAESALAAGGAHLAGTLLDDVDEDMLDPLSHGRLTSIRASATLFLADPALVHAAARMLQAAASFHGHDAKREQTALIKAFEYALPAERLLQGTTLAELGLRIRSGAESSDGIAATVLRGISAHILLPYRDAVPEMRAAVEALEDLAPDELVQYGTISVALTTALWDAEARRTHLLRTASAARDAGALQMLDSVLWIMSLAELFGGSLRRAQQYIDQVRELRRAIGYDAENVVNVALLAWSETPRAQVEAIADGAAAMGFGGVQSSGVAALAIRDLAEGLYSDAYKRLKPLIDDPFLQATPLSIPDIVEAASRSGHVDEARDHVCHLEELASANGSPWCTGVAQRSRALVADDPEPHFRAAVSVLEPTGIKIELGRTHLLYGEWLRRAKRRRDARTQLRTALELFESEDALWFAARSRNELQALGERFDAPDTRGPLDLTTQELTVARLAAAGHTNAEIGATMFLSANTVDYHLRKVFGKLGLSSRRQLADRLGPTI